MASATLHQWWWHTEPLDAVQNRREQVAWHGDLDAAVKYEKLAVENLAGQPFYIAPPIKASLAKYEAEAKRREMFSLLARSFLGGSLTASWTGFTGPW